MRAFLLFIVLFAFMVSSCAPLMVSPQESKEIISIYKKSIDEGEHDKLFQEFMNGKDKSVYFISSKTNRPVIIISDTQRKKVTIVFDDFKGVFRMIDAIAFQKEGEWKLTIPSYAKTSPAELQEMHSQYTKLADTLEATEQAKKDNEEAAAKNAELAAELEKAKKEKAAQLKRQKAAKAPQEQARATPATENAPATATEAKTEEKKAEAPAPKESDTEWTFSDEPKKKQGWF